MSGPYIMQRSKVMYARNSGTRFGVISVGLKALIKLGCRLKRMYQSGVTNVKQIADCVQQTLSVGHNCLVQWTLSAVMQ